MSYRDERRISHRNYDRKYNKRTVREWDRKRWEGEDRQKDKDIQQKRKNWINLIFWSIVLFIIFCVVGYFIFIGIM